MPSREAATLRELLTIREARLSELQSRPGYRGSAVGFKYSETSRELKQRDGKFIPCITLFVDRKADPAGRTDLLPDHLSAGEISCATDVVVGYPGVTANDLAPLDPANQRVRHELEAGGSGAFGGMPLRSELGVGAAACVAFFREQPDQPGLLTAQHVAGPPGTLIERPPPHSAALGVTAKSIREVSAQDHLPGFPLTKEVFRLDAAFVLLDSGVQSQPGVTGLTARGEPPALDLDDLGLLGVEVESVGPVRGRQRGRVVGFAYEWDPGDHRQLTDWLIVGEHGGVFAEPGDSGKLILRADTGTPVALLWGGRPFVFQGSGHQEAWCYASHLRSVLDALDLVLAPGATTGDNGSPVQTPPKPPTTSPAKPPEAFKSYESSV